MSSEWLVLTFVLNKHAESVVGSINQLSERLSYYS